MLRRRRTDSGGLARQQATWNQNSGTFLDARSFLQMEMYRSQAMRKRLKATEADV
jgi:hypothetical protein